MQLLQPLLCCSTKSEMILVTDRVPACYQRGHQLLAERSQASEEEAGDVLSHRVVQRRQRQSKAVPTEMSMACDDDAAPAPYYSSSTASCNANECTTKNVFLYNNKE